MIVVTLLLYIFTKLAIYIYIYRRLHYEEGLSFTSCFFLPQLEVQCLYAIRKHEGKEGCKTHQNSCNWPYEVRIITEVAFNVRFYRNWFRWSRHWYSLLNISILWYDQPVHGPRYRADPIIPHPPFGNSLKFQKKVPLVLCIMV